MIDAKYLITQQGKVYVLYAGLLDLAHRQSEGRLRITTTLVQLPSDANDANGQTAVCHATAGMYSPEGQLVRECSGLGDASPANVSRMVAPHLIRMAECFPLSTEVLSQAGWKRYDDLRVGEPVLGYDVATDRTHWVPLLGVNVFSPDEVPGGLVRLTNASVTLTCTPDHTWAVRLSGKRVHAAPVILRRTRALTMSDSIVLAAACDEGESLLPARDAAVLGWLATDGTLRASTVRYGERAYGPYWRAHIDQSKPAYVDELRALLAGDAYETDYAPRPVGVTGRPARHRCHRFGLTTAYLKSLLRVTRLEQTGWEGLPQFVLRLDPVARAAMLDAMLKGDGAKHGSGWVFGKQRKPGVMEAFELLATLGGYALGRLQPAGNRPIPTRSLRVGRYAQAASLRREPLPAEAVWCPTTPLGTCVARFADQTIAISGQTRAKARAVRDLVNVAEALDESDEPAPVPEPAAPIDALEVLRRRYARLAQKAKARGIDAPALAPDADAEAITAAGREVQATLAQLDRVAAGVAAGNGAAR